MPIYSQETLDKYPWLYRRDDRRNKYYRLCKYSGHVYKWYKVIANQFYVGLCTKCGRMNSYKIDVFHGSHTVKAIKCQYDIQVELKPCTNDEIKEIERELGVRLLPDNHVKRANSSPNPGEKGQSGV